MRGVVLALCLLLGCGPNTQPQGQYVGNWAFSAPKDGAGQRDLWLEAVRLRQENSQATKALDARLWGRGYLQVFSELGQWNIAQADHQLQWPLAEIYLGPNWIAFSGGGGPNAIFILDEQPFDRSSLPSLLHPMTHLALGDRHHSQYPLLWNAVDDADFDGWFALWVSR